MNTAVCGAAIELPAAIAADNSQWVHVMPEGKFSARDGRSYDLGDPEKVMAETRRYHGKTKMVVDYDHQSVFSSVPGVGGRAPAAGWISGLQVRPDGIWAFVNWTEEAAAKIRAKAYRYLSPVFIHEKDTGRVIRLTNVALTNSPALDMTAVARSEDWIMNDNELAALRKLLDLPETADFSAIIEAINNLKASGVAAASVTPDPAKFVPIGNFERVVADANKLRQGVTEQAAASHVAQCINAGKLLPFMKDWAVSLCTVNKPAFDSFIERTGPAFTAMMSTQFPSGLTVPGAGKASTLSEAERAVCANFGMTEEEFVAGRATSNA